MPFFSSRSYVKDSYLFVVMNRLLGLVLPLISLVLVSPALALELEPLQRSMTSSPVVSPTVQRLDLSLEQMHLSESSKNLGDSDEGLTMQVAPGEKGRPPAGHSLLDLSF